MATRHALQPSVDLSGANLKFVRLHKIEAESSLGIDFRFLQLRWMGKGLKIPYSKRTLSSATVSSCSSTGCSSGCHN